MHRAVRAGAGGDTVLVGEDRRCTLGGTIHRRARPRAFSGPNDVDRAARPSFPVESASAL